MSEQTQTWEQLITYLGEPVQKVLLEALYTTLQKEEHAIVTDEDVVRVEHYLNRLPEAGGPPVVLSHTNEVTYPERYKSVHDAIIFLGEYIKRKRE